MKGPDGRPKNLFDRGPWINILEFIGCPCYHVDYMTIMTLDDSDKNSEHSNATRGTELTAQTGTMSSPKGTTSNPLNSSTHHDHSHDHGHSHEHVHHG